ncbi:MAG: hypothetical protein ABI824_05480 [Acidobacteriota bacterium]
MSAQRQVRTTISLPAASLKEAKHLARARNVNLSTVVGEALSVSLQNQRTRERTSSILDSYRRAFAGFSEDELMLLDGIVPEEPTRSRKKK